MPINSIATDIGNKSLDALWMRSNAISNNIANADTPGYQEKTVSFENELTSALADNTITAADVSDLQPTLETDSNVYTQNGNGVDIEQQMIDLARNQLQYNYMERAVSANLNLLNVAAKEGRS